LLEFVFVFIQTLIIDFCRVVSLQVSNRVAVVELVSTTTNAHGGIDIVASVRDANGAPVSGRALSCWVRSTCGLVNDMAPGWVDTLSWIQIANSLNAGPGTIGLESPMSELALPSYCSTAGYPPYVCYFVQLLHRRTHTRFCSGF
jgi:hypothetical protein